MKIPSSRELQKLNKTLAAASEDLLLILLNRLRTAHHRHEPLLTDLFREIKSLRSVPLRKRDYTALVRAADSLSEQSYPDAASHFAANQFAHLIRKYPFPKDRIQFDPEEKAALTFHSAEHRCSRMNVKLRLRRSRKGKASSYEYQFHLARNWIRYVIGDRPQLDAIYSRCQFGPGASLGVNGNASNFSRKLLAGTWTVSPGALPYARSACLQNQHLMATLLQEHSGFGSGDHATDLHRFSERIELKGYNKISFVPKTAKTHRSIAIEPLLNTFIQKGIDETLRLCLKRVNLDLTDQSANQEMARQGSLPGQEDPFCTIDLSSASDSISIEIVRELLPPEWFEFLNSNRSHSYELGGTVRRYHKFVSMGNGFCFPLQTLIFSALIHACSPSSAPGKDFRVYGDDMIVRKSIFGSVVPLLRYAGFRLNANKTFSEGLFRESCGADWFGGLDVRPYILDERLDSIESLYKFLNLTASREGWKVFFEEARGLVLSRVPSNFRFFRPFPGEVDSGIDSTGDEHLSSPFCFWKNQKWSWLELTHHPVKDNFYRTKGLAGEMALMYACLCGSASTRAFTFRRKTKTKVTRKGHSGATSQWLPRP